MANKDSTGSIGDSLVFLVPYTLFAWVMAVLTFGSHFIFAPILAFAYPNWREGHMRLSAPFLKIAFFVLRFRIRVRGIENLLPDSNYIVMASHQSMFDIVVMVATIPHRFSFFAKQELLRIPIVGHDLRIQDHFVVDRANPRVAARQLELVKQSVIKGRKVLIFPEGTRSKDGQVGPFKKGAFWMAAETGAPIIPCWIGGTGNVIRKNTIWVRRADVEVVFGSPIASQFVASAEYPTMRKWVEHLVEATRDAVISLR